jgi:hypothetical protein
MLPVASRKPIIVRHCHSLKTCHLTLSSAKSAVDTVLKVESGSDCSVTGSNPRYLTCHPPDLSTSTSPDSYPQPPMVPFHIGGHLSPLIWEWIMRRSQCCWNHPLLSPTASQKRNHFYKPRQYPNFAHSLIQCLRSSKNHFMLSQNFLFHQKLFVVFRGLIAVVFCPGQTWTGQSRTKLSINFEPFLVQLEQWTISRRHNQEKRI